jgi:lipopolysaccharide export system permease protein
MTRGIFFRHVLREIAVSTLVVALVLLVVLATYQLSFVLGRAADGQVPGAMVPELALLSLRTSLAVILPFALLLGIVLALGRLYHDNEIAAAQACGVPASVLFLAAGVAVAVATALAGWTALRDGPRAARRVVELRTAALRDIAARQLVPGTFSSPAPGITIYFGSSAVDGSLRDVFVQRDLPGAVARMQVLLARSARHGLAPAGDAWRIELLDGRSYEGMPGAADWRVTTFELQLLRIPVPRASLRGPPRVDGLTNRELLAAGGSRPLAELHWRIGWVIEVMVLGLAAVALARLAPRQGRYARLPWAVLLFGVYAGLLTAGRTMLARGELPAAAGLWWAHALAIMSILLLVRVSRRT